MNSQFALFIWLISLVSVGLWDKKRAVQSGNEQIDAGDWKMSKYKNGEFLEQPASRSGKGKNSQT